ncbi:TPR domain protein in aerotolerance operon [uncultured Candidatus Thioglobus sp.]|nr:TPR domain protein in aerotolerance operon [uncultured Candidatus Thioglobus sp.]
MKIYFLLLFFSFNAQAGLFDFIDIKAANQAYEQKNYKLAAEKYGNIDNDAARLNQANSLYKQGLYKQSLEKYNTIKQADLTFERLYNAGNAYAKSDNIEEAIKHYLSALKLKQDKDAAFNLKLLKKQKKQKKKSKQDKSAKQKKKDNKKSQQQKGKKDNNKKDSKKDNNKKDSKKDNNKKDDKKDNNKKDSKKDQQKSENKQQREKLDKLKQNRWNKSLNRNLKTLMIPFDNKQQNNNDKENLW